MQSDIQNGVVNSGDAVLTVTALNTSTGALTFTTPGADPVWVKNTSGVVVPVTLLSGSQTLTPASLPASSTKYAVYGVEVDSSGVLSLVKGADTATQLNTGALIASNTPATTNGKLRLADFALRNISGTINFSNGTALDSQGVNWIDRRAWARGAYNRITRNRNAAGGDNYTFGGSTAAIDPTNLVVRVECTGVPVRLKLNGVAVVGNNKLAQLSFAMDGSLIEDNAILAGNGNATVTTYHDVANIYDYVPSSGSHLFAPYWNGGNTSSGTQLLAEGTIGMQFSVEEIVRQNANNGIA